MARRVRYQPRPNYRQSYQRPPKPRRRLPRLAPWQRRGLLLVLLLVGIVVALQQLFAVRTVQIEPAVAPSAVKTEVLRALHNHLGQSNLLTLSTGELTSDLLASDPAIKSATVTRQWPHGLIVEIEEKVASLGWSTAGQTFILDHSGVILQPAATTQHLVVVQDDSNLPVKVGDQVTSAGFVAFCQAIEEQIPNTGLAITKLEIHDTTFDLYATTNKGYQVIFDTSRDPAGEMADLKATLAALVRQHKTPTQYIDLRIAGRAYYQ